jgi:hypothetical protein
MSSRSKQILGALAIVLVLAVGYVFKFGLYPRYYDIQYDEEVQLHDGRIIVVHIKRAYQRKGLMLEQFPQYPYRMGMEFSFDRGPFGQRFSHYIKRGDLGFIDQKDGKWYIGYGMEGGDPSAELGSRAIYPNVAILNPDGSITKPQSWNEVPSEITQVNIMPSTPDEQVMSKFNGTKLTLQTKMQHWAANPIGAGDHTIHRITPQSITQGNSK